MYVSHIQNHAMTWNAVNYLLTIIGLYRSIIMPIRLSNFVTITVTIRTCSLTLSILSLFPSFCGAMDYALSMEKHYQDQYQLDLSVCLSGHVSACLPVLAACLPVCLSACLPAA